LAQAIVDWRFCSHQCIFPPIFVYSHSFRMPAHTKLPTKVKEPDGSGDEDDDVVAISGPTPADIKLSHPRLEIDAKTAKFRQNAVHVYGLDFLKTEHVNEIFNQFHHKFIEWINDSSANIIFAKPSDAKEALEALSYAKPEDEPWRRTPDILVHEGQPPIFLQLRLAATSDVKRAKKAVPKVTAEDMLGTRRRQRRPSSGGKAAASANSEASSTTAAEATAATGTKRQRMPATPEEEEKRRKRAARFGEWLEGVASKKAASDAAAAAAAAAASATAEAEDENEKESVPAKQEAVAK